MSVVVGKLVKLRRHYASAVLWSRWDDYMFTSDDRNGTISNGDVALVIELYEEQAGFVAAGVKVYFNNIVGWLPLDWIEEAV